MAEPATTAAEAEAGVLRSLLEEGEDPPGGDAVDISIMAKDVPATSSAPASTANVALVPIDVELNTLVAQQHAAAHQARAAAALEQADAAEERQHQDQQQQQQQQQYNQVPTSPQLQQQQQQHHVTLAANSPPLTLSAQDSHRQPAESVPQTAPIVIPSATADMEDETSLTPGSPDLTLSSVPSSMNICLCQQPARIPRPRNAFILYRQHNQAAVVAHHPGKPNPEISKIIGEMWRTSSEEVKKIWQKHADDEKKQHLLRYPDYRYQPRRNGKKNAAAAAAAFSSAGGGGALSPSIETTICSLCGGRTGTLSTPQTPGTPSSAVPKTPRLPPPPHISRPPSTAPPPAKKRRTGSSEDPVPQTSPGGGSASGVGVVDQAGVEALLQLGHLQNEDESNAVVTELQTPVKKRKLNEGSPMTGIIGSNSLSHSFYNHLSQSAGDPNIDPFLRHNGIESESPTTTTTLDHEGNLTTTTHYHQLPNFTSQLPDTYMMKPIPALEKINAFNKICKPLPSMSGPGFARLPIVAIEGEDIETVAELFHALAKDIRKSEPIHVIDEPEIFAPTIAEETADIEGLLIPNSLDSTSPALVPVSSTKDKGRHDNEDDAAARYLSHVASWRRRCVEIKKTVTSPPGADGAASVTMAFGEDSAGDAPSVVLVNRYMVSRSDLAAARLAPDGLSPLQHWQWCATVWRGCVGPDMTIYVNPMPEGGVRSEEAVEVRDSGRVVFVRKEEGVRKEWDEKIVRRLGFEVGEVVRSLRGFGG